MLLHVVLIQLYGLDYRQLSSSYSECSVLARFSTFRIRFCSFPELGLSTIRQVLESNWWRNESCLRKSICKVNRDSKRTRRVADSNCTMVASEICISANEITSERGCSIGNKIYSAIGWLHSMHEVLIVAPWAFDTLVAIGSLQSFDEPPSSIFNMKIWRVIFSVCKGMASPSTQSPFPHLIFHLFIRFDFERGEWFL